MVNAQQHRDNCNLAATVAGIQMYIEHAVPVEELQELRNMLLRIQLPEIGEGSELYEAKLRLDYLNLLEALDAKISYAYA